MTTTTDPIVLVAHRDQSYHGATRLFEHTSGHMLGIGRDPVRMAALRLREEGRHDSTEFVIRDADGVAPEIRSTVGAGLKGVLR